MRAVLLKPEQHWSCPNCEFVHVTHEHRPHTPFHPCAGLKGMTTPMVPAGTRCKIEAVEREDYIGRDDVRLDADGRPIMAVITTRDDGYDTTVYAPCVNVTREMREELADA